MNLSFLKYILRFVLAVAAAWVVLRLLGLVVAFGSTFPLWAMSLVIGFGCVLIALFYRRERRLVSKQCGRWLVALRCASYCIAAFIIMQPILHRTVTRRIERTVAVLLDVSDSMRFTDDNWNPGERLSLARQAGLVRDKEVLLPSLETFASRMDKLTPWLESDMAEGRAPFAFRRLVSDTRKAAEDLADELASPAVAAATNPALSALSRQLSSSAIPALRNLAPSGTFMASAALGEVRDLLPPARAAADELAWAALGTNRQAAVAAYTDTNRFTLAAAILTNSLRRLPSRYGVQHFELGRRLLPMTSVLALTNQPAQSSATDFTTALESILTAIPSEQLAGVLFLTDGIHNGDAAVEPVARQLGARGVHVSSVLVGSSYAPFDLAVADISAPESVFLGDKVRVRGVLNASQASGKEAKISLLLDGEKVDGTTIPISDDVFRREFALSHAPTNNGLARYELAIENIPGERFPSNNTWRVDVAVSDDRTHVLLVDDYPRWDFRYLRNLFYARDKSVHLQYVLMHPDKIEGVDVTNRPPAASASRPFGEAEAGALPESPEEWRKFDVIILGDIGPDVLTPEMQTSLAECVQDRGALLVTIAGPRAMPHAFPTNSPLATLLPFDYDADGVVVERNGERGTGNGERPDGSTVQRFNGSTVKRSNGQTVQRFNGSTVQRDFWTAPEKAYSIALTPAGRLHPVMQQSSSMSENEQLWKSLPKCHWRFPILTARSGAEIIAYAEPEEDGDAVAEATTARNAAAQMEAERLRRERQAIIIAHNVGRGKVLALNTDESWRLRYRIGDVRHHRFWGQIIRWGLGERLRSGTAQLRVGTERMTYTPHEPVRIVARVLNPDFTPVTDAVLRAAVRSAQSGGERGTGNDSAPQRINGQTNKQTNESAEQRSNGSTVQRFNDAAKSAIADFAYVPDSQGLYEAFIPPIDEPGAYTVTLLDPERYSGEGEGHEVSTMFFVASSRRPIEMANVSASRDTVDALARWTGGRVVSPHEAEDLAEDFGEGSRTVREPVEIALWCRPWLFLLLVALVCAEWVLRKMRGLV